MREVRRERERHARENPVWERRPEGKQERGGSVGEIWQEIERSGVREREKERERGTGKEIGRVLDFRVF